MRKFTDLNHRTRRRAWRLCMLAIVALCGGCTEPDTSTLRVGINLWPPDELLYLAQEKGFFVDAGVDVRLVEFDSLPDARRAFELGKIDGFTTTPVETLLARDQSRRDARIVRVMDASNGADVILAPTSIGSVAELRGKRVAVELASLSVYVLTRALEQAQIRLDDVTVVPMTLPRMSAALVEGEVDAIVTFPPYSLVPRQDERFHTLFSSRDIPGEVIDVVVFDGEVLRQRGAEVRAFLAAHDRAFSFLQLNREEAWRVMGQREHLSGAAFGHMLMDGITLVGPAEQAVYFGPSGKLQPLVEHIARTLRANQLLSDRADVTDCIAGR